jgi:hypothetical protein
MMPLFPHTTTTLSLMQAAGTSVENSGEADRHQKVPLRALHWTNSNSGTHRHVPSRIIEGSPCARCLRRLRRPSSPAPLPSVLRVHWPRSSPRPLSVSPPIISSPFPSLRSGPYNIVLPWCVLQLPCTARAHGPALPLGLPRHCQAHIRSLLFPVHLGPPQAPRHPLRPARTTPRNRR